MEPFAQSLHTIHLFIFGVCVHFIHILYIIIASYTIIN